MKLGRVSRQAALNAGEGLVPIVAPIEDNTPVIVEFQGNISRKVGLLFTYND